MEENNNLLYGFDYKNVTWYLNNLYEMIEKEDVLYKAGVI